MTLEPDILEQLSADLRRGDSDSKQLLAAYSEEELFAAMIAPFRRQSMVDLLRSRGMDPQLLAEIETLTGGVPSLIGAELIARGLLGEEEIARCLAEVSGFPYVDTSTMVVDGELFDRIPVETMRRYHFVPEGVEADKLIVVLANPDNIEAVENLEAELGMPTRVKIGSAAGIRRRIDHMVETSVDEKILFSDLAGAEPLVPVREDEDVVVEELDERDLQDESSPVTRLVDAIILKAVRKKSSDIHIEPEESGLRVRYRIDGTLFEVIQHLPSRLKSPLVSRLKVMAGMDIAEKRVPQDGRIKLLVDGRSVDFRVSTLPSIHGETAVLRILDKSSQGLDLERLGFPDADLLRFKRNIRKPYGMILVAGPTGSGKTTTLYSGIHYLQGPGEKLITVEDPVEYQLPGIIQINVNEKKGLTFAAGLRSIVRQDPDKIMVGEIRDFETADIAINAALTGHLVLSTIHANNVTDAVGRLINMGVDPYQFVSSFNLILSQRLVKCICRQCREEAPTPDEEAIALMRDYEPYRGKTVFRGRGCRDCHETGYSGREGIFEVMEMTDTIKEMIIARQSPIAIRETARKEGMVTLREAGWQKVLGGGITLDELNRVTFED